MLKTGLPAQGAVGRAVHSSLSCLHFGFHHSSPETGDVRTGLWCMVHALHPFVQASGTLGILKSRYFEWLIWNTALRLKTIKSNSGKQSGVIIPHVSDGESRETRAECKSACANSWLRETCPYTCTPIAASFTVVSSRSAFSVENSFCSQLNVGNALCHTPLGPQCPWTN